MARGRGRSRKTTRETIKKNIEINEINRKMLYGRTLWRRLILVADPT